MTCEPFRVRSTGFALPSAIFLLVVLAALAAFLANIAGTQSMTSTQDVQGTRAYHAARAGIEWGLYQVLDPTNVTVVPPGAPAWPNLPACPTAVTLSIEGFAVTVSCSSSDYSEAGLDRRIRVFRLLATASLGVVGAATHVEREVEASVSKCRALDGAAPAYECP